METNKCLTLDFFFSIISEIEKSCCLKDIEGVIRNHINKMTNSTQSAYYLVKKNKYKIVEKININFKNDEIASQGKKIENIGFLPESNAFFTTTFNNKNITFFRYGSKNQESNYESFFTFSEIDNDDIIKYINIFYLIIPHFHTATVNIYKKSHNLPSNINYLSPRENEVLRWISEGKTNCEIGLILGISSFTVKNHVSNILEKLNVVNRVAALKKLQEPDNKHSV